MKSFPRLKTPQHLEDIQFHCYSQNKLLQIRLLRDSSPRQMLKSFLHLANTIPKLQRIETSQIDFENHSELNNTYLIHLNTVDVLRGSRRFVVLFFYQQSINLPPSLSFQVNISSFSARDALFEFLCHASVPSPRAT